MRLKLILASAVLLLVAAVSGTWYWMAYHRVVLPQNAVVIQVPDEALEVLQASIKTAQQQTKQKEQPALAEIEGKIEEVSTSNLPFDLTKRMVVITNQGELILLFNPEMVNTLRFNYIGRVVTIKGHWYGDNTFRGKAYRSVWAEQIVKVAPPVLPKKKNRA